MEYFQQKISCEKELYELNETNSENDINALLWIEYLTNASRNSAKSAEVRISNFRNSSINDQINHSEAR